MHMATDKIIERLRKLRVLTERGATEGERAAAQTMYQNLLNQYGLRDDDITQAAPPKTLVRVAVRTYDRQGVKIAAQVYRALFDQSGIVHYWSTQKRGYHAFDVPENKAAEFGRLAAQHVEAFRDFAQQQKETLYKAYLDANDLYPASAETEYIDSSDLTPEELMQWAMRAAATKAAPRTPNTPETRQIPDKR